MRLGKSGMCRSLLGISLAMTSIAANQPEREGTRFNLTGPHHADHPVRADGNLLDKDIDPNAQRLVLSGVLTDTTTGRPIAGAELDFWQADDKGIYDRQCSHLRGIMKTDAAGRYGISLVLPNDYSEDEHDPLGELFRAMGWTNTRAAHVHLKVRMDGVELLTTQLFMSTSTMLDDDYVEGAVSKDLLVDLTQRLVNAVHIFIGRFDISVTLPAVLETR